jgi:hypothetical protein
VSRTLSRMSWRTLLLAALCALGIAAPAQAGPLVASAQNCDSYALEQPFLPWADINNYVMIPGGTFESGTPGWGAGNVVGGNEPYYVHGSGESSSLKLAGGESVTTPTMCVGLNEPTLRLFGKSSGLLSSSLKVEVLFEDATGAVRSAPIGAVTGGGWAPSAPLPIVVNLLPLLPDDKTPVQFRFTAQGGSFTIDDVYVDPRYY